jgi:hypothetical protein
MARGSTKGKVGAPGGKKVARVSLFFIVPDFKSSKLLFSKSLL